jgi:hypothetical protein
MKRSEMVQKLADMLPHDADYSWHGGEIRFAYNVLAQLEELGMLPPYREKTKEEMEYVDAINQYNYCHRWEPE